MVNPLPQETRDLITEIATAKGLDTPLLTAVVIHESSGNPWAWNPEPRYRYMWDVKAKGPFRHLTAAENASATPPPDFHSLAGDRDQEWWGQRASWGLIQVMGAVARQYGFEGLYLTQLTDPRLGLTYGAVHLTTLLRRAQGRRSDALAMYNAGDPASPQGAAYAAAVLTLARSLS